MKSDVCVIYFVVIFSQENRTIWYIEWNILTELPYKVASLECSDSHYWGQKTTTA